MEITTVAAVAKGMEMNTDRNDGVRWTGWEVIFFERSDLLHTYS